MLRPAVPNMMQTRCTDSGCVTNTGAAMPSRFLLTLPFALMLLASFGHPARAQESTPVAVELPAWVETWISTQETEDIHGFTDLYTHDATYEILGDNIAVHDSLSIREVAGMSVAALKDLDLVPTAFHAGDNWAVLEYTMSFAAMLDGGKQVSDVRVVTVFDLDDEGLITRSTDYFDSMAIQTQLGNMLVEGTPAP